MDWNDADTEEYVTSFLHTNARRLHEAVAANPMTPTRCFHWTVRLVLRTLFTCDDKPGLATDSIAAHDTPGIFGYVRACLGVAEPQMREALRIHMLVQLLGFSHPEEVFANEGLAVVVRRLWYFAASISFRSTIPSLQVGDRGRTR